MSYSDMVNKIGKIRKKGGVDTSPSPLPSLVTKQQKPTVVESKPIETKIPSVTHGQTLYSPNQISKEDKDIVSDLQNRGETINKINAKLALPNFIADLSSKVDSLSGNSGNPSSTSVFGILSNTINALTQKDKKRLEKAKDVSMYSDEQLVNAYNNMPNQNMLQRLDANRSGLSTAKQMIKPTVDKTIRQNILHTLNNNGLYNDFLRAYIPQKDVLATGLRIATGSEGVLADKDIKMLRKDLSEKTGFSEEDLLNLGNYLYTNGIIKPTMSNQADKLPALSSLESIPLNFMGTLQGTAKGVESALTGKPIDTSTDFSLKDATQAIRGTVSNKINNPVGEFAYNIGMAIGDSLLSQAVGGGVVGTAIMGMGAYTDTLKNGIEKGLTPQQAQTTALASGAFEYLFEKISWDKIKLIAKGEASKNILANIGTQMLTEGGEEIGTDIANTVVDVLVNGGASEMAQLHDFYVANGMSDKDAQKKTTLEFAKQLGMSGLGGAISGGLMGGGASLLNKVTAPKTPKVPSLDDFQKLQQEVKPVPTLNNPIVKQQEVKPVPTIDNTQVNPEVKAQAEIPSLSPLVEDTTVKEVSEIPVLNQNTSQKNVQNEIVPFLNEVGNVKQTLGDKISKVRTNTDERSGIHTEEEGKQYLPEEDFSYQSITEEQSIATAQENLNKFGTKYVDRLMSVGNESLNGSDVDALMSVYASLVRDARASNDTSLWAQASKILKKVQTISTKNGQAIQALAKWSRSTPEGELAEAMQYINEVNNKRAGRRVDRANEAVEDIENAKTPEEMEKAVEKATKGKNVEDIVDEIQKSEGDRNAIVDILRKRKIIDDRIAETLRDDTQLQAKVLELLTEASKYDVNSRESKELKARAGKMLAEKLPKTIRGRVSQVLYNNMLGNVKTLVSRNMGGNLGVAMAEQARQPLASLIDKAVSHVTGSRTTTGWSTEKQGAYVKGFAKGFLEEIDDFKLGMKEYFKGGKTGLHTVKDGYNTLKENVKLNESAFKGNNILSKLQNFKNDLVKNGLSLGDRPFYEATKAQAKVEINQILMKNQIDTKGLNLDDYIEQASDLIALESVYQGNTKMSQGFQSMRNGLSDITVGIIGFDPLTQVTMPFVKTPSNVIDMALEYSPFGAIKNIIGTVTEVKKGEFNQRRFVDETSRNIVGTAILAACVGMFMGGLTTGGYDEDKDIKNAQKAAGMQEYALKVGNKNIDLGWVPVLGQSIEAGASIGDNVQKGKNTGEVLSGAFGQSVQSVLDQSMLRGVADLLSSGYGKNNVTQNILKETMTGLSGQVVPSFLRQVAQSTDDKERNLGTYGTMEYNLNNIINSVPFLRQTLEPKYDNEGREVLQNQGRNTGLKFLENMILPGKVTEVDDSPITNEAMRLYESTGEKVQFIPTASMNDISEKNFIPTTNDFNRFKQILGNYNSENSGALIESDYYNSLDDFQKTEALQSLYTINKQLAKSEIIPYYTIPDTFQKKIDVYKDMGIDGLIVYMNISSTRNSNNAKDTMAVIRGLDISDEDKGYYVEKFVSLSNASLAIQNYYGDKGLYDWYNMRTLADYDGTGNVDSADMTYQIIKSGMSYEDMVNFASVLFEDSKKATAKEKAIAKLQEVYANIQYYQNLDYIRRNFGVLKEDTDNDVLPSLTPTKSTYTYNEGYQKNLDFIRSLH